jgi:hypothetical protein
MLKENEHNKSLEHSDMEKQPPIQEDNECLDNESDVILEVPSIKAESVNMDAENLKFSISVKAKLSNISHIEIGTDIQIDKIKLDINSLEAEAFFTAKLKKIESIFVKALESIDKNPDINIKNDDQSYEK